ncbi:MAG: hypothetical protein SynsKO_22400 [Synoicihabitans sp.]
MKTSSHSSQRGSLLITAMLLTLAIGISLVSFLKLGQNSLEISNRAFHANASMNLAESGLEQAMWSIGKAVDGDASAWTGWTTSGSNAWRKFTGFNYDANTTGYVRVYVRNHTLSAAPTIIARGTITPANGPSIEKWVVVSLTQRSLHVNGLVAKDTITFSGGNAVVDSYDSRLGSYNQNLGGGKFNRYARGSAGSGSVSVNSFSLSNSSIYGNVAIGTADYSGLSVGPNGLVGDFSAASGSVDYGRVTTDFTTNFDDAVAPTTVGYTVGALGSTTLPRGGDLPAADGKFYYNSSGIGISGNASKRLNILAGTDVVIRITAPSGSTGIDVKGQASINVLAASTLEIYTEADVSIAGRGIANSNDPASFMLYSTRPSTAGGSQSIKVAGNGQLSAVVYAPNADVTMNGGGSSGHIQGSVVAETIAVTGGSEFHYDEALGAMTGGNPFGVSKWAELTTAPARNTWAALVNF